MPRDKPYTCIVCNQRFVNSQVLANHFKKHDCDSEQENINILYKDELSPSHSKKTT